MAQTPEEREIGPVRAFLSTLGQKLNRLVAANFICFLLTLPVMTWFYLMINTYINAAFDGGGADVLPGPGYFCGLLLQLPPVVFYILFFLSAAVTGPMLLGLCDFTRRMVTGRHVWLSDLFDGARANARQGVILGLASIVLLHILLWNIFGGAGGFAATGGLATALAASRWISAVLLLLLLLTLPYAALNAVSIRQPLGAVVRNGLILARVRLWRSLLVLLGLLAYWLFTSTVLPAVSLLTLPLISLGLSAMVLAAVCGPAVEKYILDPARREQGLEI